MNDSVGRRIHLLVNGQVVAASSYPPRRRVSEVVLDAVRNVSRMWEGVVSFTFQLLYPPGKYNSLHRTVG